MGFFEKEWTLHKSRLVMGSLFIDLSKNAKVVDVSGTKTFRFTPTGGTEQSIPVTIDSTDSSFSGSDTAYTVKGRKVLDLLRNVCTVIGSIEKKQGAAVTDVEYYVGFNSTKHSGNWKVSKLQTKGSNEIHKTGKRFEVNSTTFTITKLDNSTLPITITQAGDEFTGSASDDTYTYSVEGTTLLQGLLIDGTLRRTSSIDCEEGGVVTTDDAESFVAVKMG